MASPASKPVSNLAAAFAAHSTSANIPIPREGGHLSAPDRPNMLLTPPNSISPNLPPHKHRPGINAAVASTLPAQVDSDIDLQDAVEHAAAQDQPSALSREALRALESVGEINAEMLAMHYLPGILADQPPLAIRFIMQALCDQLPGWSKIPITKARRLVVAGLEWKKGEERKDETKIPPVIYEKTGWGKWTSRPRLHPSEKRPSVPIGMHGAPHSEPSPPASVDSVGGRQISQHTLHHRRDQYSSSWAADSLRSSRDEEMADRMSLDGSEASDSASESDSSDMDLEDDLDDDTDMEDLSKIAPDTLRELGRSHGGHTVMRDYNKLSKISEARYRSVSARGTSIPLGNISSPRPWGNLANSYISRVDAVSTSSAFSGVMGIEHQGSKEAEAAAALLQMGSM
ncbi:putative Sin3 binding protein-domain-containing protein [Clohesyomyces aquaticus]|uniref:Putative Sin3 binding protein-domain-containing protein n=1 Tax=Clohesyomyces aquaticus TaxID=1231657 RepID=A0A1Y1ZR71_9PLEO|nr:putative Sin3 binding protein-domain-containing protein [Clohesyomyces aquaticus]